MALKCGKNKKVACKVQLSVSLMLAKMQNELGKLITIQYVHKILLPLFVRPSMTFRAFPLDKDSVKIMF